MAGKLIGLMNHFTEEIIVIEEFADNSTLGLNYDRLITSNALGKVYSIEQFHKSNNLNDREYRILYKLHDVFFERFVTSETFSPVFYRDMKPKFKQGDILIEYRDVDRKYKVTKIDEFNYHLTNIRTDINISQPIDEVNDNYIKQK